MNSKEYKVQFSNIACQKGFKKAFGGWFIENQECIMVLDLQKSNYGNYFEVNIKIYIQGIFNTQYFIGKHLIKNDTGDIFIRQPQEYSDVFNFEENKLSDYERIVKTNLFFDKFLSPFIAKAMTVQGLKELEIEGLFILPSIKIEMEKILKVNS